MDESTRQMDSETVFRAVLALWRERLASGWEPPPNAGFPWVQVKRSLEVLVRADPAPEALRFRPRRAGEGGNLALICAGNTPLLAWPAMLFALKHGVKLFVKMSQHETLWPRLLKESIDEVSPEAGERIVCDVWPGEDSRSLALARRADALIVYGSDASIARWYGWAERKPFLGFGHAVSVGLYQTFPDESHDVGSIRGFARDILMYGQQGCLSPHTIFVDGASHVVISVGKILSECLSEITEELGVLPIEDMSVAIKLREVVSMAQMGTERVIQDPELRWTVIYDTQGRLMPAPVGHGVVHVLPTYRSLSERFSMLIAPLKGRVSCVGVAGEIAPELRAAIEAEGVSRICQAGEMQMPPLDWKNGGVDLEAWIAALAG
jgi:hypothetical protein